MSIATKKTAYEFRVPVTFICTAVFAKVDIEFNPFNF